jgi:hypothetical protein
MKRFLMSAVAVAVALVGLNSAAYAGGPVRINHNNNGGFKNSGFKNQIHNNPVHHNQFHNGNFNRPNVVVKPQVVKPNFVQPAFKQQQFVNKNYCQNYGVKKSFGYCYVGQQHCHWQSQCYSPQYGCQVYYCPSACGWYWWCAADCCYYPVSYCPHGVYH